jgi:hypothetical protein
MLMASLSCDDSISTIEPLFPGEEIWSVLVRAFSKHIRTMKLDVRLGKA